MGFGLYLHIPYCLAKCRYCDFYSAGASRGVPDEYVDALIARTAVMCPGRPETLYFGGGTPSLLSPAQVSRLVRAAYPLPGAEITVVPGEETNIKLTYADDAARIEDIIRRRTGKDI